MFFTFWYKDHITKRRGLVYSDGRLRNYIGGLHISLDLNQRVLSIWPMKKDFQPADVRIDIPCEAIPWLVSVLQGIMGGLDSSLSHSN